jgi:hypothetical protein
MPNFEDLLDIHKCTYNILVIFYRRLQVSTMFFPFEGGQGDEFIVEKTEFLLFKIKIIPLAPFKRGKLLPILKFSVNFEIKRYLIDLCISSRF